MIVGGNKVNLTQQGANNMVAKEGKGGGEEEEEMVVGGK